MRVAAGDLLLIMGQHAGESDLRVKVVETHGANGTSPWRVRWGEEGHEGLLFPGPEAAIEHAKGRRDERSGRS
jgi:hypothetical protein